MKELRDKRGGLGLLVALVLLIGILLGGARAFAIEQKKATLISYDSIKNLVQLNIDGGVYTVKLHQLCVVARPDGTKGDYKDLLPGLTVKVWVDKIPPETVYAIQILEGPKVAMPRTYKEYPRGVTPDKAPTRGYATYPYEKAKQYYSSPTSTDWRNMPNSWWPWDFYIAGPVVLDPYGFWWGPLAFYGYYDPYYYYGYYTFDAINKEPNLPEFRYLMAVEDSLYNQSERPPISGEEGVYSSSPALAQNYSGNYYSYAPYMYTPYPYPYAPNPYAPGHYQSNANQRTYQPASRPDLLAQASDLRGYNQRMVTMQFGPSSGTYKEFYVKLLGVDLSTTKLIIEGAKDTYIFTAQTNFLVKRRNSYKYDVIPMEEATRLAYPARAKVKGYYLSPHTFLVTDVIIFQ